MSPPGRSSWGSSRLYGPTWVLPSSRAGWESRLLSAVLPDPVLGKLCSPTSRPTPRTFSRTGSVAPCRCQHTSCGCGRVCSRNVKGRRSAQREARGRFFRAVFAIARSQKEERCHDEIGEMVCPVAEGVKFDEMKTKHSYGFLPDVLWGEAYLLRSS